jgi:hypothetical protein
MIIIRITSGLGNQLFQYAMARAFTLRNNALLKLDISFYKDNYHRIYGLNRFNIHEEIATYEEINSLKTNNISSGYFSKLIKRINSKRINLINDTYIKEKSYCNFDSDIFKYHDNKYFDGYWANEKYFIDFESQIRKEFTLKRSSNSDYSTWFEFIENSNSVSVHIRRGDYLSNDLFCALPFSYYEKAVNYLFEHISNPVFYIFSDDISWVKTNMKFAPNVFYVTVKNPPIDYVELILMSRCKHQIIANSTFSWWGAWLNENTQKIVIAPKKWYSNKSAQKQYSKGSLIPSSWIKI